MTPRRACRAFVAGFGKPGLRDLDFGRQVVDWLQQLDWPDEVVVEDLSCSVPLVLHRLQELRPSKVVLLGAVARGVDPPGTVRRYHADLGTAPDEIGEEALVDIDHTLAVARQWGGLPVDTVVIEVEPAETGFGLGFSEPLAGCLDGILHMVREELVDVAGEVGTAPAFDPAALTRDQPAADGAPSTEIWEPTEAMGALLGYARRHAEARAQSARAHSLLDEPACQAAGVALVGRVRPWGVCVDSGGDWFDAIPLGDGLVGIVVGNVAGRGVEVAATMSDLRAAARAYAVVEGTSPARLVGLLDRLADATGLGQDARLLYLTVRPATGEVRFTSAGASPPLIVDGHPARGRYLDGDAGASLGGVTLGDARTEGALHLAATSTLLLCTDGLLEHRTLSRGAGLERFQRAAMAAPTGLNDLVDHVLTACTRDLRRDDDICLVGVRVGEGAVSPSPTSHFRR